MPKGYTKVEKSNLLEFMDNPEDLDKEWKKEWKNMPEFIQDKVDCFSKLVVRFATLEDLEEFKLMIKQPNITHNSKSIWHPKRNLDSNLKKRYK